MISLKDVSVGYTSQTNAIAVVDSLTLEPGQISAILGSSGCGKSTLLNALAGVHSGTKSGKLMVESTEYSLDSWVNKTLQAKPLFSLVPQRPMLLPWKTALENVLIAAQSMGSQRSDSLNQAKHFLDIVNLKDDYDRLPEELSQGMAARVSLARSLMLGGQCLLLDEPFASLDALTRLQLQDWLREWIKKRNLYAILVTHDIEEAKRLSSHMYVFSGKPAKLSSRLKETSTDQVLQQLLVEV